MDYLRKKEILTRLVIMTVIWITVSFNYYLIQFQLKYFPGDIYLNSTIFSVCGICAYLLSPFIYASFGIKRSFFAFFLCAAVGGLLIVTWGY